MNGNFFLKMILYIIFFLFFYIWEIDFLSEEVFVVFIFLFTFVVSLLKFKDVVLISLKNVYDTMYNKYVNICMSYIYIVKMIYMYNLYVCNYIKFLLFLIKVINSNILYFKNWFIYNNVIRSGIKVKLTVLTYLMNSMFIVNFKRKLLLDNNFMLKINSIFYISVN